MDKELKRAAREAIQAQFFGRKKALLEGLAADNLFELLSPDIAKARETFFSRLKGPPPQNATLIFEAVLNDFLFAENSFIPCPIW